MCMAALRAEDAHRCTLHESEHVATPILLSPAKSMVLTTINRCVARQTLARFKYLLESWPSSSIIKPWNPLSILPLSIAT
ncbi:hypothetical protein HBI56_067070 [Parastagonospora nodorum]|nr:hypothetical protein HBH56_001570 [Parastagonospora nodorum]KAH3937674.1 hypothetical protein HBH54_001580 [Parastagonospora nodorum]KAH3940925.1 hypothetical protein HBH53_210880 [Parastagonospora nodorum]KAH3958565.1 hypothetical protein HBH51_209410 [Parastagonospora nodorum]KAH3978185.1 hypothetical protein HBH52_108560 [Parastagonospora nodorum]